MRDKDMTLWANDETEDESIERKIRTFNDLQNSN
jgi:hypothetical protein